MDALQAIANRKSVREYLPKAVEDDKIEALIKAGNGAPKAGPFQITVVQNAAVIKEINDKALQAMKDSGNEFLMSRAALKGYQPLYGAPLLVLFSIPEKKAPYAQESASNAATSMTIAATALGLGSCYAITPTLPFKSEPALVGKLGIPAGFAPSCAVLLGYAGGDKFATPKKELKNINYYK